MGLLSLAIWLPVLSGVVLLALGRDEHAGTARWVALKAMPQAECWALVAIGTMCAKAGGSLIAHSNSC